MIRTMTRTFVTITVLIITIPTVTHASTPYGFVQFEAKAEVGIFTPTLDILAGGQLVETEAGSIGIEAFALVSDGWAELYAGPTWTPIPELATGLSAGMETRAETLPRFAASLIINHSLFNFFGAVEFNTQSFDHNQTGLWYKLVATLTPVEWLKLGLEWRRFAGFGPHVAVSILKAPLEFWVSWTLIEPEQLDGLVHLDRFLFGGKVEF